MSEEGGRTSKGSPSLGIPAYDEEGADVGRFTQGLHQACERIYAFGYELHMDVADGGVPTSCLVSSVSLHNSQAAIPLVTVTQQRVTNCYDLTDSA